MKRVMWVGMMGFALFVCGCADSNGEEYTPSKEAGTHTETDNEGTSSTENNTVQGTSNAQDNTASTLPLWSPEVVSDGRHLTLDPKNIAIDTASTQNILIDEDCNGSPEQCFTNIFDANAHQTGELLDYDCDGQPEESFIWTYDTSGNRTSEMYVSNFSGTPEGTCRTWSYDAQGHQLNERYDGDCDGILDGCSVFTYDTNVRPAVDMFCGDLPADAGEGLQCVVYTGEMGGGQYVEHKDYDCDGTFNACSEHTYDGRGNLTSKFQDNNCDGFGDAVCEVWDHDADGNPLIYQTDNSCDGIYDGCFDYSYDSNGNRTNESYDEGCADAPLNCTAYAYDANNNLTQEAHDEDCDGAPDVCFGFGYDREDRIISNVFDLGCDGSSDGACVRYVYE